MSNLNVRTVFGFPDFLWPYLGMLHRRVKTDPHVNCPNCAGREMLLPLLASLARREALNFLSFQQLRDAVLDECSRREAMGKGVPTGKKRREMLAAADRLWSDFFVVKTYMEGQGSPAAVPELWADIEMLEGSAQPVKVHGAAFSSSSIPPSRRKRQQDKPAGTPQRKPARGALRSRGSCH
jgi:hypothetical protein